MNDMELAEEIERIYAEAFVTNEGEQIVGLHSRPLIVEAHRNALAAIIAALRRGNERQIVTDAMVDAVIRRARDGHPPAILDGDALYHIRAMLQTAMDAIERPPSGEMVMVPRRLSPAIVVEIANEIGIGAAAVIDAHNLMLSLSAAEAEGRKPNEPP